MAKSYLDKDGVLYFWQKIKTYVTSKIPTKTSQLTNDSGFLTSHQSLSGYVPTSRTVNGHALSSNVTVTKSDVGLGNVGNFKAVSTVASQGLSDTEKANARANIGAGASSFSGSYNDLTDKPTIPTVDSVLSNTSTNPVQNKIVASAFDQLEDRMSDELDLKVDVVSGKGLSTNDFTNTLLTKLNGIATGANKTTVDSTLSTSSTNPVQNKVINTALGNKANLASPTFTGTPKAPTATAGTATTQIATTAFVANINSNLESSIQSLSGSVDVILQGMDSIGQANGIAQLDSSGKVPTSQLPSYVDDVIEVYANSTGALYTDSALKTAVTGEAGKIYVVIGGSSDYLNNQYRYSGTAFIKLADGGVSSITNAEIDTIVAS